MSAPGTPSTPSAPGTPDAPIRIRFRYVKRGRLRFTSGRDFARIFERALRRAGIPMAYSAGFNPHPKISYSPPCSTGTASEAEYVEITVTAPLDPQQALAELNQALPAELSLTAAATGDGHLADALEASGWRIELTGIEPASVIDAVAALQAEESVIVTRRTKSGQAEVDLRAAIISIGATRGAGNSGQPCAIIDLVVRHGSPSVRPGDVLDALAERFGLGAYDPPLVTRYTQGPLLGESIGDPLGTAS